jgi:hypothetical protein
MAEYKARCMKCKEERDVKDPEVIEMEGKGGSKRRAVKGKCAVCGTKVYKFLPKEGGASVAKAA